MAFRSCCWGRAFALHILFATSHNLMWQWGSRSWARWTFGLAQLLFQFLPWSTHVNPTLSFLDLTSTASTQNDWSTCLQKGVRRLFCKWLLLPKLLSPLSERPGFYESHFPKEKWEELGAASRMTWFHQHLCRTKVEEQQWKYKIQTLATIVCIKDCDSECFYIFKSKHLNSKFSVL